MSYGAKLERDICFDCDQKDCFKLQQALLSIKISRRWLYKIYMVMQSMQCACDYMFSRSCGYYNEPNSITDVIFLTDGHSNLRENVCTAANCIPHGVNVVLAR